jgi:hypothetical protein
MVDLLFLVAAILFPFVAMPLMWRRMKRVRSKTYDQVEPAPSQQPWAEALRSDDGLTLARMSDPNDSLIALGDKAKHATWPISNQ